MNLLVWCFVVFCLILVEARPHHNHSEPITAVQARKSEGAFGGGVLGGGFIRASPLKNGGQVNKGANCNGRGGRRGGGGSGGGTTAAPDTTTAAATTTTAASA